MRIVEEDVKNMVQTILQFLNLQFIELEMHSSLSSNLLRFDKGSQNNKSKIDIYWQILCYRLTLI